MAYGLLTLLCRLQPGDRRSVPEPAALPEHSGPGDARRTYTPLRAAVTLSPIPLHQSLHPLYFGDQPANTVHCRPRGPARCATRALRVHAVDGLPSSTANESHELRWIVPSILGLSL